MHHLEQDPNGNSFPTVAKTLKEVFRISKTRWGLNYYIRAVRGKLVLSSDTSEHTEMAETVTEPWSTENLIFVRSWVDFKGSIPHVNS